MGDPVPQLTPEVRNASAKTFSMISKGETKILAESKKAKEKFGSAKIKFIIF